MGGKEGVLADTLGKQTRTSPAEAPHHDMLSTDLGFEDELGDDNGVVLGDASGLGQVGLEVGVGMGHVHSRPAQHVGRPHQARVPHLLTELLRCLGMGVQDLASRSQT